MIIKLDEKQLRANFNNLGYSLKVVDDFVQALKRDGLPIQLLSVEGLTLKGGTVDIKFLNSKGEAATGNDALTPFNWEANISGISPSLIKSITIPKLQYEMTGLLALQLEIYPFELPEFKSK
jgi:hypothetical protein